MNARYQDPERGQFISEDPGGPLLLTAIVPGSTRMGTSPSKRWWVSTPLTPALMYWAPTIGVDEVAPAPMVPRRAISDQKSFSHAAIAV